MEATISKSLKTLGFIKRSTVDFRSVQSILSLYKSLILPSLTYGSAMWAPYTKNAFAKLESIQHKLLRYCSLKLNQPMHFFDHNYEPIMKRLNLSPLTSIFRYYDYTIVYRILRDQVDCPELKDLFVSRELTYNIRNPRPIHEDCHSTNYAFYSPIGRLRRA